MSNQDSTSGKPSKARPLSTIALDFSTALDDLFKLDAISELAEKLEKKNEAIANQKSTLTELEDQLKKADEELRRQEMKYKRMSRRFNLRQPIEGMFANQSSSSDTDESSSQSRTSSRTDSNQTYRDHYHGQHQHQHRILEQEEEL